MYCADAAAKPSHDGGQRQRMEMARVLAADPSVIIMDEATSALVASTGNLVVKNIGERGVICIIIAHRLLNP